MSDQQTSDYIDYASSSIVPAANIHPVHILYLARFQILLPSAELFLSNFVSSAGAMAVSTNLVVSSVDCGLTSSSVPSKAGTTWFVPLLAVLDRAGFVVHSEVILTERPSIGASDHLDQFHIDANVLRTSEAQVAANVRGFIVIAR